MKELSKNKKMALGGLAWGGIVGLTSVVAYGICYIGNNLGLKAFYKIAK